MRTTKKIILSIALLVAVNKVSAQNAEANNIVIEGTADSKYNGEYVHIYNNVLKEKHDSTIIANGEFSFTRPFTEPTRYMFYSGFEIKTKHGYAPFGILVDHPSVIHIDADMESLSNSKVTGSAAQDIYNHFKEQTEPAQESMMDQLYAKYGKDFVNNRHPDTSSEKYKSMAHDYSEYQEANTKASNKILENLIRENPASFASIVLLDRNTGNLGLSKLEELYGLLAPLYKKGYYASQIENSISGLKKSAIGNLVENFTLNDPQGNPMNFNSLKGKYVLIDFWGSWCAPCHVAFKELRDLYSKYHSKGFDILGIATETNKGAWVKDINKEKLPWLQVVDNQGSQSISQKQFAVTKYPTTVLIDPDGKIIGRDLSEDEIIKKLDSL